MTYLGYILLMGCHVCKLKYLWLSVELQHYPIGKPSNLANYHRPFSSVVGLVGKRQASEDIRL